MLVCRQFCVLTTFACFTMPASSSALSTNIAGSRPLFSARSARMSKRLGSQRNSILFSTDNSDEEQVDVILESPGGEKVLQAQKGETLRTAMLRRGASPHNGRARLINCRGLGTCGTCAVEICGAFEPADRTTKERLRLNFPPHGSKDQSPNLRLACQIQVQGDVTITKRTGFWGQDSVAKDYDEAQLWFGDLEYILDNKSPPVSDRKK